MVNESDAIEIMSIFRSKGIQIYLDGGWGVDALIGFESRCHNDIDIFIEKQDKECSIKLLNDNGYSETVMAYLLPSIQFGGMEMRESLTFTYFLAILRAT